MSRHKKSKVYSGTVPFIPKIAENRGVPKEDAYQLAFARPFLAFFSGATVKQIKHAERMVKDNCHERVYRRS